MYFSGPSHEIVSVGRLLATHVQLTMADSLHV